MKTGRVKLSGIRGMFILGLGSSLMVLAILSVVLLRPNWNAAQRLKTQVGNDTRVLQETQAALHEIETFREAEQKAMQALSVRAGRLVPRGPNVPGLLNQLQQATTVAGLNDVSITTGRPQPVPQSRFDPEAPRDPLRCGSQGCWTLPVAVSGRGPYASIAGLLDLLGRCDRLVTVSAVNLSGGGDPRSPGLGFDLQLEAFFLGPVEGEDR